MSAETEDPKPIIALETALDLAPIKSEIFNEVIDKLKQSRRDTAVAEGVKLVAGAFAYWEKARGEYYRDIKPDIIPSRDSEGKQVGNPSWSDAAWKKKQEAEKKWEEINNKINSALQSQNLAKLKEFAVKGGESV